MRDEAGKRHAQGTLWRWLGGSEPPPTGPITAAEVLSAEAYARCRPQVRRAMRARKEARRLTLGDRVTVLFESRDTVLLQIHEVLHVEGGWHDARVAAEIAAYAPLVPEPGELAATVLVDRGREGFAAALRARLRAGRGLSLELGDASVGGVLVDAGRPEDAVSYVRFDVAGRSPARGAALALRTSDLCILKALPEDTRHALAWDLRPARAARTLREDDLITARHQPRPSASRAALERALRPPRTPERLELSRRWVLDEWPEAAE